MRSKLPAFPFYVIGSISAVALVFAFNGPSYIDLFKALFVFWSVIVLSFIVRHYKNQDQRRRVDEDEVLARLLRIKDSEIDCSDIHEADAEWFSKARKKVFDSPR